MGISPKKCVTDLYHSHEKIMMIQILPIFSPNVFDFNYVILKSIANDFSLTIQIFFGRFQLS